MRLVRVTIALWLLAAAPAAATSFELRTFRASLGAAGAAGDGASLRPSLNAAGTRIAFASEATTLAPDPNGTVRDVFVRDLAAGTTRLVADVPGGANGPSDSPVLDGAGDTVVFVSAASNLVEGDTNGAPDVFIRTGDGPIRRVSLSGDGVQANGASSEPDVSRDGRVVVFTSAASNLVPEDTNRVADVFVKDLESGAIRRLSSGGRQANGASGSPAISPDGGWASFQSRASNLVGGDRNRTADVFLAEISTGEVQRVSVSSSGRQQNRSVVAPFTQISDVSEDGRFVAFDSDATNLVPRDTNRDTDVFVHNRETGATRRVSVDLYLRQGDNDSFAPSISADGRYVAFESFAQNLVPKDRAREDVFVHDRRLRATSIVSVTARGRSRGPERVKQLLQRPALTDDARVVAFSSTAENLVAGDGNRVQDVFIRLMHAPAARFVRKPSGTVDGRRVRYRMRADDPAVAYYLCEFDRIRAVCPPASRLQTVPAGRHRLRLRAGGFGMLFAERWATARFRAR